MDLLEAISEINHETEHVDRVAALALDESMNRLRELNRRANSGQSREGITDIETAEACAAAVVDELEHLAAALAVELGERRTG